MNGTMKEDSSRGGGEKENKMSKTMMSGMGMGATMNATMTANFAGAGVDNRAFKFMQDMLTDHENRLESILDLLDEKIDKPSVEALISNKIGKEEIADLLPDMTLYE